MRTSSVLKTKLHVPSPRPDWVARPRLYDKLTKAFELSSGGTFLRKMTLLSAPAGFGKTTLLSEWISRMSVTTTMASHDVPVITYAWLSLDGADNDPIRFYRHLVAAINAVNHRIGAGLLTDLQDVNVINAHILLTSLINEITVFTETKANYVLVLDDYQAIEMESIESSIAFLVEHLPPNMHVVISSRCDPDLPLSRIRARGELVELREAELRFSDQEMIQFLRQAIPAALTDQHLSILKSRTEGWITGLQLAALAIQNLTEKSDLTDFIDRFGGSHKYVIDYLVDEVLVYQSSEIQMFLMDTSILERMTAGLCDSLTIRTDSHAILTHLEAENLFLIPLDEERSWYRYHHLFAELLRRRLAQKHPAKLPELHKRASNWFNATGAIRKALHHAMASGDEALLADLLVEHTKVLIYQSETQVRQLLKCYRMLSDQTFRDRPLLSIYYVRVLVFNDPLKNLVEIKTRLTSTERSLADNPVDDSVEKLITGHIAAIRGTLSHPPILTDHDSRTVIRYFRMAQQLLPDTELAFRCSLNIGIAYEYMHLEDTRNAILASEAAHKDATQVNNRLVALIAIRNHALIAYYQGDIDRAMKICEDGIARMSQWRDGRSRVVPGMEILNIMQGYLCVECGELALAEQYLKDGLDLLRYFNEYESIVLYIIAQTRLYILKRDYQNAHKFLELCEQRWSAYTNCCYTLRASLLLMQSERDAESTTALHSWIRQISIRELASSRLRGISPWAETQHLEYISWMQVLVHLAQTDDQDITIPWFDDCVDSLEQAIQSDKDNGLVLRQIEHMVILSVIMDANGKYFEAVHLLSDALVLAEPRKLTRIFLDKGSRVRHMLTEIAAASDGSEYSKSLLSDTERSSPDKSRAHALIEPLTARELEILNLIAQGLTNREIGERLFLALTTVKGHNRRIFGKLGVRNRTEAVKKAVFLGIISL